MRKKVLIAAIAFMGIAAFSYAFHHEEMQAAGSIIGSNNHEAGNSLQLGEEVHMGGSALSDDLHTVLGVKDGYVYLLRKTAANNGTASNYNNALNYANSTYKTQLGSVGSAYLSQSGNAVSLIAKNELINLGVVSNDALVASIPQLTGNWWLKDADTNTNRASFMTNTNSMAGTNTINQTTVSGNPNSDAGGTCGISQTTETGVLPINSVTQTQQLRHHYLSEAIFVYSMTQQNHISKTYNSADCTGNATTSNGNATTATGKQIKYSRNSAGVETWQKVPGHGLNGFLTLINHNNFRPKAIGDTSSFTVTIGQCYPLNSSTGNVITISGNGSIKFTTNNTTTIKITNITDQKYQDEYCAGQTTNAGSALIRPYIKMAVNDILMRNNSKRTYTTSSSLAGSNIPVSDNAGEYLTVETSAINVGLRSGASGVSGNQFLTAKPKSGTVVSLPLSFSGSVEGTRYVSAEAVDTSGNTVYGVLKAVGSTTSDSVDIDFANLLASGVNSFQVTLYLEDAGSKNTAYRSVGTPITIQFENSDYPLSFTKSDVTNIKIGEADVKETITTDNTEITTSGSNAAVYTLSGGIAGTGLSVTNDPSDPKGFIISIGNTTNPSLPANFILTAKLKTATSNQATATKQIHVFQAMSDFKWLPKRSGSYSTSEAGNNVLLGNLEVQNGLPQYTYALTSPSDSGYDASKAADNSFFTVTNTALGAGAQAEVKTNTALTPGTYNIQCKVTDSYGDVLYTDFTITVSANEQAFIYTNISGNELPKSGNNYLPYQETYAANKTFQLYTAGNPTGSTVTYQLKAGSPSDVISVDPNGTVSILNASLSNQIGKVIVQATSHDPSGNYSDKTIELPINIDKGTATISFDDPSLTKKSVSDAAASWNETATANPTADIKITYEISGGKSTLINIDKDSGQITYVGSGDFGKVEIKAIVDDDPSTGHDNYDAVATTKEIVIYREVDGTVIPDPRSSSNTIPTFTASDPNAKQNGIIGTIQGTLGTPDNITGGTTTYTYGIKTGTGDANLFRVDPNSGVIKAAVDLGVKSYNITVTVSDKWSTKEIPVTIIVDVANAEDLKFYENSTSNIVINTKSVKATDTGVTVFATVKGSSNTNPVTYRLKTGEPTNVIDIQANSGAITIKGVGTVIIVAEKDGTSGQAKATAELTFTVTAGEQNFIFTDATLSNELPKIGTNYQTYTETYAPSKTFQLYTAGNPSGSTVTYQLKTGSPADVISVDPNGSVSILNASLSNQIGKVIVQATSHDPSGNYSDKTIELPITIEKGTRTIAFADQPIYVTNGSGSTDPTILTDGIVDISGTVTIEVDPNEDNSIAWTNDGKTIYYHWDGAEGKDIKLHATKPGDRNYKLAEADGILHILGAEESALTISTPGKIIYGDHFTIRSTQDDSYSTNVQYSFTVNDPTYISNPTVNGNQAEFDALKYSGNTELIITVTRTADGEIPLSKEVKVKVLPKPITIKIEDKEKYKGEVNPPLTVQDFTSQLVSWNGTSDVMQTNDIHLSTTAQTNSPAGGYPIKGDADFLNQTYPNYTFSFEDGTLTIKEDNIADDWYHMETDADGQAYSGDWTNQNVNIIRDHLEYVNLSPDQSTWKPNSITISNEGNNEQSFWMKKDSGAITSEKKERIKIDKTSPKVKNIQATDANNRLQDIIHQLSGGIFFKPGTSFAITTDDSNDQLDVSGTQSIAYQIYKVNKQARAGDELIKGDTITVMGEKASITIAEITGTYKVCVTPTDGAGNTGTESCHEIELKKIDVDVDDDGKPDFNDPDGDGCPDLNIKWKDDDGQWVVINGDRDYDGIPDLNIDSDGDGKPDLNIDSDDDGRPDLNLVMIKKDEWKPTTCVNADEAKGILEEYCTGTNVKPQINVDLDDDGIPDINIDTDGDMKADINITKAGSDDPYLNLTPIKEWKPDKDYKVQGFAYDTDHNKKPLTNVDSDDDGRPDINIDFDDDGIPDINIDSDGDHIPDINIDSDGDGKPDINVDTNNDGTADENIMDIAEWKPEHNVDYPFPYDTMKFEEKKELEDNGVIVEKPDGTFAANVTLKVTDVTKDKQSEVMEKVKDLIKENSMIKVYDVKLLANGKEIEPDGTLRVKIPVESKLKNPQLLILNEEGEYEQAEAVFEDGYLIVETDHLGQFILIGEMDDTDVNGYYYPGVNMGGAQNIAGALTGDTTNIMINISIGCMALGIMLWAIFKQKQKEE